MPSNLKVVTRSTVPAKTVNHIIYVAVAAAAAVVVLIIRNVNLKHICLRDSSASSTLEVLDDNALYQ